MAYNNSTNTTTAHPVVSLDSWFYAIDSLCTIGSVNNLFIFLIIVRKPELRKGPGILISHLVAINLTLCGIHVPISVHFPYHRNYSNVCRIPQFLFVGTTYTTYWSEFFLAVNRLVAIQFPHKYRPWARFKTITLMIATAWIIGIGSVTPGLFDIGLTYARSATGQL